MTSSLVILYISLILFVASLVLWFISGFITARHQEGFKTTDIIGGFLFAFSLVGGLVALFVWLFE